jgi:cytochrome oxidase assembly protein ShyY1
VRWTLLIVFVAVLGTVFVKLGDWQLDRLEQRRERNAATVSNEQAAPEPAEDIFNRPIADSDQWKKAIAIGTFDAEHQFLIRYRQNGDADGYQVVTPLRTSTGALLVDRGFVSLPRGNQIPAVAPAPPTGTVTVEGYVRRNEQGSRAATQPENGQVRLINSDALQSAVPYPVSSGYLSVLTMNPPQSGGFVPLLPPEINEGPHFWYALQWFMFAGIGILGIVVFIRADVRDRRLAKAGTVTPAGVPEWPVEQGKDTSEADHLPTRR